MSLILQDSSYIVTFGKDLLKDVNIIKVLGQGNCAVYEVQQKSNGRILAMKEILLHNSEEEMLVREESQLLKFVSVEKGNSHFIRFEDFCVVEVNVNDYVTHSVAYILMEKATMSLNEFVQRRINQHMIVSASEILFIAQECATALAFLQENRIAHSDIKPENILIQLEDVGNQLNLKKCNTIMLNDSELPMLDKIQKTQSSQLIEKEILMKRNTSSVSTTSMFVKDSMNKNEECYYSSSSSKSLDEKSDQKISKKNAKIKICDIGSAVRYSGDGNSVRISQIEGTIPFLAPELIKQYLQKEQQGKHNPYKSDVYSFGLCLLFLATQQRFFKQTRLCMDQQTYAETLDEWMEYANVMQSKNTIIRKILQSSLQLNYEQRPDFVALSSMIGEVLKEDNLFIQVNKLSDFEGLSYSNSKADGSRTTISLPENCQKTFQKLIPLAPLRQRQSAEAQYQNRQEKVIDMNYLPQSEIPKKKDQRKTISLYKSASKERKGSASKFTKESISSQQKIIPSILEDNNKNILMKEMSVFTTNKLVNSKTSRRDTSRHASKDRKNNSEYFPAGGEIVSNINFSKQNTKQIRNSQVNYSTQNSNTNNILKLPSISLELPTIKNILPAIQPAPLPPNKLPPSTKEGIILTSRDNMKLTKKEEIKPGKSKNLLPPKKPIIVENKDAKKNKDKIGSMEDLESQNLKIQNDLKSIRELSELIIITNSEQMKQELSRVQGNDLSPSKSYQIRYEQVEEISINNQKFWEKKHLKIVVLNEEDGIEMVKMLNKFKGIVSLEITLKQRETKQQILEVSALEINKLEEGDKNLSKFNQMTVQKLKSELIINQEEEAAAAAEENEDEEDEDKQNEMNKIEQFQEQNKDIIYYLFNALQDFPKLKRLSLHFESTEKINEQILTHFNSKQSQNIFFVSELNVKVTGRSENISSLLKLISIIVKNSSLCSLNFHLNKQILHSSSKNEFISLFENVKQIKSLSLNLKNNKIKKEFVMKLLDQIYLIKPLQYLKINFSHNQISFNTFTHFNLPKQLISLDLNFDTNSLDLGIPSLSKQVIDLSSTLTELRFNFRQNRQISNDYIIFLFNTLKQLSKLATFALDVSDNSEIDDSLVWKIRNISDLSSWICSDLILNLKNLQVALPSLQNLCEYLSLHKLKFRSVTCTVSRRFSMQKLKEIIQQQGLLDKYDFFLNKKQQYAISFTLSLKQHVPLIEVKDSQIIRPEVLCSFLGSQSNMQKMYRCLTCEAMPEFKDYFNFDGQMWKFCQQCIYICHKNHHFIEQRESNSFTNEQCICNFISDTQCKISNCRCSCTSLFTPNLFQRAFKCIDCSDNQKDTYICTFCKDKCHQDHITEYSFLSSFECSCTQNH